jgi:hypothetical protein
MDLQLKLAQLADQEASRSHDEMMGQIEVNKVEAANPSLFVAGWRPAIGWACVAGTVYSVLLSPLFHLPMADTSFLETILLGILGIGGGLRTIEKVKGVSTTAVGNPAPQEAGQPAAPLSPPRRKKFLGLF